MIDIVKDQIDYVKEEDPKLYISEKTGRGPLTDTWLEDYWTEIKVKIYFTILLRNKIKQKKNNNATIQSNYFLFFRGNNSQRHQGNR